MKHLLPVLLACIAIVGCAPITPYRTELKPAAKPCIAEKHSSQCPDDAFFLVPTPWSEPGDGIPIGIVEFDDQGALQSRSFKDEILNRIRGLTEEHGTLTVVFAHGWLNNAAPKNENLARFREMLKGIAKGDREICEGRSCEGRKVVGVYLAWRGMAATLQPFAGLSFWNRKSRAHRVGQDGATEVLAELAKIKAGTSSAKEKSRLILIGHSFGGAVIYSAVQQLLMKDAAFVKGVGKSVDRTTANLVILVNPAFEAARLTALHDRAAGMCFPKTQSPILAIFTSKTDLPTKVAFPTGRLLSSLFTKYNPDRPRQSKLDRTAIGHYRGYQTHELRLGDKDAALLPRLSSVCRWERFREGKTHDWDLERVVLERKHSMRHKDQRTNPYYNVAVDDAIISGHSGIWEPEFFMEFIFRLVTVQDAKSCREYLTGVKPEFQAAPKGCPAD